MAYKVIILYQLYMPSYFLGTFTEYPYLYTGAINFCIVTTSGAIVAVHMIQSDFVYVRRESKGNP